MELSWEVAVREPCAGNQNPRGEAASVGPGGESREKNEEKTEAWGTDRKTWLCVSSFTTREFFHPYFGCVHISERAPLTADLSCSRRDQVLDQQELQPWPSSPGSFQDF